MKMYQIKFEGQLATGAFNWLSQGFTWHLTQKQVIYEAKARVWACNRCQDTVLTASTNYSHYTVDYRKSTHQSTSAANNCCRSLMDLVSRHRSSTPYTYTSGTDSPRTERQPQRLQLTSTDVSDDDKTIRKQQQQQQHYTCLEAHDTQQSCTRKPFSENRSTVFFENWKKTYRYLETSARVHSSEHPNNILKGRDSFELFRQGYQWPMYNWPITALHWQLSFAEQNMLKIMEVEKCKVVFWKPGHRAQTLDAVAEGTFKWDLKTCLFRQS